jgi:DNA-binding transcriptional MerR regulator
MREQEAENAAHFYHIGDVATLTGLSADALRAWERVGLLTPHRSTAGVRRYTEDDLARIRLIARTLQKGGYSRRAVAKLLQSGDLRPDAADYAPGPARLRRSRRGRHRERMSRGSDQGAERGGTAGESSNSTENPMQDQDEQDEVRSERRTLEAVARISDALASGRALAEVLEVICSEACRAFGVSDSILWLVDPPPSALTVFPSAFSLGTLARSVTRAEPLGQAGAVVPQMLGVAAAYGPHSASVVHLPSHLPTLPPTVPLVPIRVPATGSYWTAPPSLPLDDQRDPVVRAFHTRRGLIVNRVTTPSLVHPLQTHPELSTVVPGAALLVIPLLATNGTPIGVLSLSEALDPERFDSDDLERVRLFAVQATLAIETARLHADIRVAREQAEEHRARWQAAVDDLPALVCICDSTQSITYISPTCGQVLGWPDVFTTHPEIPLVPGSESWVVRFGFFWLGEPPANVQITAGRPGTASVAGVSGASIEQVSPGELPLPRALRENQAVHAITVAHRCPDGMERLVSWDAAPMRTVKGELLGAVAVGHDVTQEHRQHEREACLAAVTHAAAGAPDAQGMEGRANRILTALVTHTRKPVISATLYLLDEESGMLRRVGVFGAEHSGTHAPALPLSRQHPWWHLLIGGAVYSSADGAQPRWLRAIGLVVWKASSLRAWATVPLRAGEKLVGALSLGLSVPHVWDAAERAWLEACADAVMMGVENDRLFAAEQQKSRALEVLLAAADDGKSSYR